MKKIIGMVITVLVSKMALADMYCGANIEKEPGSQIYNKLVYWEKTETLKPSTRFLLQDGTLIRSETMTPELLAKVVDGTLALSVSFFEGRAYLVSGITKRAENNEVRFINTAIASSLDGKSTILVANGASFLCKEMAL